MSYTANTVTQDLKINNKSLSSDVNLTSSDVSAVPITRTVNNQPLSADITIINIDYSNEIPVSGTTYLTDSDMGKIFACTGTASNYTIYLPSPVNNSGKIIQFRMDSSLTKLVTLDASAGTLIDGVQTRILWANESVTLFCDGVQWIKMYGKSIPMWVKAYFDYPVLPTVNAYTKFTGNYIAPVTNYSPLFDSVNKLIRIQRPGTYESINWIGYNNTNASTGSIYAAIYKNGVGFFETAIPYIASQYNIAQYPPNYIDLVANDYIELYGRYTAGSFSVSAWVNGYSIIREVPTW